MARPVQRSTTAAGLMLQSDGSRSYWSFMAFEVRAAKDKGQGAFALCDMRKGIRILAEPPLALWVVPDRSDVRRDTAISSLMAVINRLEPIEREGYFSLAQLPDGDVAGLPYSQEAATGIWMTNAYPLEASTQHKDGVRRHQGDSAGVFEQIARLNHSCNPSCILTWNPSLGTRGQFTLHAARDIRKGEELTTCYWFDDGARGLLREERVARLEAKFGFECRCECCSLTGSKLHRSERAQKRIRALSNLIESREVSMQQVYKDHVPELLGLLEQEGVPSAWGQQWMLRARAAAARLGDEEAERHWASCAAECARLAAGEDSNDYAAIMRSMRTHVV